MFTYDDDTLREINEHADLVEYASRTMELCKRGEDYFTNCPKHIDKTPSLSFTPTKNSYYCFSCGASGGIIGFLMDFEGLDFKSAVEKAAGLANVDMSTICHSETMNFLRKLRSLKQEKKEPYAHPIISQAEYEKYSQEPVPEWLDEGISQETLDLFGVRIDKFQNRIIYPVCNIEGELINIKARTRNPKYKMLKIPKYINYYSVGVMDYFQSLNITLPYIKEANEVIIFESIKSVMKAYGWGYKNCVSAEKHTLTKEQVELLVRLRVNVVLAYDTDVDYKSSDVKKSIDKLKRVTNVYIVEDIEDMLGGIESKNSPADCGQEVWRYVYEHKKKVV